MEVVGKPATEVVGNKSWMGNPSKQAQTLDLRVAIRQLVVTVDLEVEVVILNRVSETTPQGIRRVLEGKVAKLVE